MGAARGHASGRGPLEELLYEVPTLLTRAVELWSVLPALRETLAPFLAADHVEVLYRSPRSGRLQRQYVQGGESEVQSVEASPGDLSLLLGDGRLLANAENLLDRSALAARGLRSAVVVPIAHAERVRGALLVGSRDAGAYGGEHVGFVADVARLVATATQSSERNALLAAQGRGSCP
jgi:GAF domain-containing protein